MEEFLKKLEIVSMLESFRLDESADHQSIDIKDSDQWDKIKSKLDRSYEVKVDDDATQLNSDSASIQYYNDKYTVTLTADLAEDTYRLSIRKNN